MAHLFVDEPRDVNLVRFVKDRAEEICDLLSVVQNYDLPAGEVSQGPRTFVQRLPRHLRRRAMSHNIKRLPRRLQNGLALAQTKQTKHRKKPPSRYHRRRPSNLLQEYNRRVRKSVWLETHIWHAKRFHMQEVWGYKLAERSASRGYRASYRDAARHCLINDISYMSCIQLVGPELHLTDNLRQLTSKELGASFREYSSLEGVCEGRVVLYEPDEYPLQCIGPVTFIWKPKEAVDAPRCLWIWCHPAIHHQLIHVLIQIFALEKRVSEPCTMDNEKKVVEMHSHKLVTTPLYSDQTESVIVTDLKNQMFRFSLTGPLSTAIVQKCLVETETKNKLLASIGTQPPSSFPNGLIAGFHVTDPRLIKFSNSKTKPVAEYNFADTLELPDVPLDPANAKCRLWECDARREALLHKMSDKELNEARSKLLGGYASLVLHANQQCIIPVLLICRAQTNTTTNFNFGSGWDIVGPLGWAMPFWLSLQKNTARAAGQRELRSMALPSNIFKFPFFWPDTNAGIEYETTERNELQQKYLRRPHNRRVRYEDLKMSNPFSFPWDQLVEKADTYCNKLFVCRNRIILNTINNNIANGDVDSFALSANTLIPVKIKVVGRGVPKRRGIICLADNDDIYTITNGGQVTEQCIVHHTQQDCKITGDEEEEEEEDVIRFNPKETETPLDSLFVDMKSLRANKRKATKKLKKKARKIAKTNCDQNQKNDESVCNSGKFIHSCSRRILGLIVQGDFVFSEGSAYAFGYCSYEGLQLIVRNNKHATVLFRNTTSKYYHLAHLSVLKDFD